jgi:hypothetical protein
MQGAVVCHRLLDCAHLLMRMLCAGDGPVKMAESHAARAIEDSVHAIQQGHIAKSQQHISQGLFWCIGELTVTFYKNRALIHDETSIVESVAAGERIEHHQRRPANTSQCEYRKCGVPLCIAVPMG